MKEQILKVAQDLEQGAIDSDKARSLLLSLFGVSGSQIPEGGDFMTLEKRKDNTYFDQTGKQILVGDLLKVFHFRSGKRNYYFYPYHSCLMMKVIQNFNT